MERLTVLLPTLLVLSGFFWLIETRFTANPEQPPWLSRRGLRTDLTFWFFTPVVARTLGEIGMLAILLLIYRQAPADLLTMLGARDTLATRQSMLLQVIAVLVLGDFIGYWIHRCFHTKALWKLHAVHHSSEQLDWLSAVRLHPVNGLLVRWIQITVLVLLGFNPLMLAVWAPVLSFYAIFLHANVTWDFGPLRGVLASPRFHRWHHTSEEEGGGKNFASLLPVFDIVFGTWYMPPGRIPGKFGVSGKPIPEDFVGQLAYPFRRSPATEKA